MEVVARVFSSARIWADFGGWEDDLPRSFARGIGVFAAEGVEDHCGMIARNQSGPHAGIRASGRGIGGKDPGGGGAAGGRPDERRLGGCSFRRFHGPPSNSVIRHPRQSRHRIATPS